MDPIYFGQAPIKTKPYCRLEKRNQVHILLLNVQKNYIKIKYALHKIYKDMWQYVVVKQDNRILHILMAIGQTALFLQTKQ